MHCLSHIICITRVRIAEEKLGLIPMVDAEDMAVAVKPDERSIMTQVHEVSK